MNAEIAGNLNSVVDNSMRISTNDNSTLFLTRLGLCRRDEVLAVKVTSQAAKNVLPQQKFANRISQSVLIILPTSTVARPVFGSFLFFLRFFFAYLLHQEHLNNDNCSIPALGIS